MMQLFAPLAAYAANEARGVVRRQVGKLVGYAIAAVGAIGLVVVGLVSLHRQLALLWGPAWADAALGGLMAIIVIVGLIYARAQARPAAPPAQTASSGAMAAAAAAAPAALGLMRGGGRTGLAAAGAAIVLAILASRASR